jgi:hypothetical protein
MLPSTPGNPQRKRANFDDFRAFVSTTLASEVLLCLSQAVGWRQ